VVQWKADPAEPSRSAARKKSVGSKPFRVAIRGPRSARVNPALLTVSTEVPPNALSTTSCRVPGRCRKCASLNPIGIGTVPGRVQPRVRPALGCAFRHSPDPARPAGAANAVGRRGARRRTHAGRGRRGRPVQQRTSRARGGGGGRDARPTRGAVLAQTWASPTGEPSSARTDHVGRVGQRFCPAPGASGRYVVSSCPARRRAANSRDRGGVLPGPGGSLLAQRGSSAVSASSVSSTSDRRSCGYRGTGHH